MNLKQEAEDDEDPAVHMYQLLEAVPEEFAFDRDEWGSYALELQLVEKSPHNATTFRHNQVDEDEDEDDNNSERPVLDKARKGKVVATLPFSYWYNNYSNDANLQNFCEKSGDLANFCRTLWGAAGRPMNQYSDMAIEMGSSRHCRVRVNDLLVKAWNKRFRKDQQEKKKPTNICFTNLKRELDDYIPTCTIEFDQEPSSKIPPRHAHRLMEALYSIMQDGTPIVAWKGDLAKMGLTGNYAKLGFVPVASSSQWYINLPAKPCYYLGSTDF